LFILIWHGSCFPFLSKGVDMKPSPIEMTGSHIRKGSAAPIEKMLAAVHTVRAHGQAASGDGSFAGALGEEIGLASMFSPDPQDVSNVPEGRGKEIDFTSMFSPNAGSDNPRWIGSAAQERGVSPFHPFFGNTPLAAVGSDTSDFPTLEPPTTVMNPSDFRQGKPTSVSENKNIGLTLKAGGDHDAVHSGRSSSLSAAWGYQGQAEPKFVDRVVTLLQQRQDGLPHEKILSGACRSLIPEQNGGATVPPVTAAASATAPGRAAIGQRDGAPSQTTHPAVLQTAASEHTVGQTASIVPPAAVQQHTAHPAVSQSTATPRNALQPAVFEQNTAQTAETSGVQPAVSQSPAPAWRPGETAQADRADADSMSSRGRTDAIRHAPESTGSINGNTAPAGDADASNRMDKPPLPSAPDTGRKIAPAGVDRAILSEGMTAAASATVAGRAAIGQRDGASPQTTHPAVSQTAASEHTVGQTASTVPPAAAQQHTAQPAVSQSTATPRTALQPAVFEQNTAQTAKTSSVQPAFSQHFASQPAASQSAVSEPAAAQTTQTSGVQPAVLQTAASEHAAAAQTAGARHTTIQSAARSGNGPERESLPLRAEQVAHFTPLEAKAPPPESTPGHRTQQVINQIIEARQNMNGDFGRVRIVLNPPNLGTVNLSVVMRGERVEIVLTADDAGVRQALLARADDIRVALQRHDLKIDAFQVLLQENTGDQRQAGGGLFEHRQDRPENKELVSGDPILPAALAASTREASHPASGRLSIFA
jgi:flagellar hook-length control protein FliK